MFVVTVNDNNGTSSISCILGVYKTMKQAATALVKFLKDCPNYKKWFSFIKEDFTADDEENEIIFKNGGKIITSEKDLIHNIVVFDEMLYYLMETVPIDIFDTSVDDFQWNAFEWKCDPDFTLVYVYAERALIKKTEYQANTDDIRKRLHFKIDI